MKQRNFAIDLVKVLAVLLVMNSHMQICYPTKFQVLSTGGGIGDALFFFCSGFTLFLGRKIDFFNWYKRRLSRILPSMIAIGIVSCSLFNIENNFIESLFGGARYWFISCILVYYILLYPIKQYFSEHLPLVFCVLLSVVLVVYFLCFNFDNNGMFYGQNGFRQVFYFLIMLQGAIMGKNADKFCYHWWNWLCLLGCIVGWYGVLRYTGNNNWQIVSALPLFGITYFTYTVGGAPFLKKICGHKIWGNILFSMGSLCLDVYLIQKFIFTDVLNFLFPLNIIVIMIFVFMAAYVLRGLGVVIRQTFQSEAYNWEELVIRKR